MSVDSGDKGSWSAESLPPSWRWVSFDEFWTDHTDSKRKLPQNSYLAEGALPVIDQGANLIGGYANDGTKKSLAPLPAIIFGDHTRAIKYIDFPFVQGADGVRVLCAASVVDPLFAYYSLRCVQLPDKGYSRHFKFLKVTQFPLAPFSEQRRIVSKINSLSTRSKRARERLHHIPRLVEKYKQAILAAVFRGELTNRGEEKSTMVASAGYSSQKPRRSIPEAVPPSEFVARWSHPPEWKLAHVGRYILDQEIIDLKDGNHGNAHPKREEFVSEGLPFITAAQLIHDAIDFDTAPRLSGFPLERLKVGFAIPGDVILSHKGTVGRAAVCDRDCVLSPQTTYYRPSPSLFSSKFLRFQILSPFFQRQLDEIKSQTTRDFVPISEQYRLFLLRPSLSEQEKIVIRLEAAFAWIDRLASQTASARKLSDHLDQAVLTKALRGELVPQDPKDEPATIILDRLREEREALASTQRAKKLR